MDKYNYYLVYQYAGGFGGKYLRRSSPIDNESALIEEHQRLEREHGGPVVIIDWKRID